MRIICDHCERQISGTVKVLAGTLNLHPDCMTELGKGPNHRPVADSWQRQDASVALVERNVLHPAFDAS
ncbi:MAG: hypothetical protein ACRD9S_07855 [Pyrinomonadaceae bacterium]